MNSSVALILILLNPDGAVLDTQVNPALSSFKSKSECVDYVKDNHERLRREGFWVRKSEWFRFDCVNVSEEEGLAEILGEQIL